MTEITHRSATADAKKIVGSGGAGDIGCPHPEVRDTTTVMQDLFPSAIAGTRYLTCRRCSKIFTIAPTDAQAELQQVLHPSKYPGAPGEGNYWDPQSPLVGGLKPVQN
jgi:hypothetical protein